jgi:hypothetical protein
VADGGEEHPDAHLQPPWRRHLHLLHGQRLAGTPRHRRCMQEHQSLQFMTEEQVGARDTGTKKIKVYSAKNRKMGFSKEN